MEYAIHYTPYFFFSTYLLTRVNEHFRLKSVLNYSWPLKAYYNRNENNELGKSNELSDRARVARTQLYAKEIYRVESSSF